MSTATVENRRTSCQELSPSFWEGAAPFRDASPLEGQNESISVVPPDTENVANAHLALDEFRRVLRETVTGVVSPLMLMSLILNTHNSATDSVSISDQLLKKYGSISNLLARTYPDLRSCFDLDDASVILLRAVRELVAVVLREPFEDKPLISTNQALLNYLKFTMAHERVECVKLLFLTARNALIRDEVHSTGTIDSVGIYPREVLRRALELGATALIVVHNHPSGDATPSIDDVEMTLNLKRALKTFSVVLHDHVIVGYSKCYSMKENDLL